MFRSAVANRETKIISSHEISIWRRPRTGRVFCTLLLVNYIESSGSYRMGRGQCATIFDWLICIVFPSFFFLSFCFITVIYSQTKSAIFIYNSKCHTSLPIFTFYFASSIDTSFFIISMNKSDTRKNCELYRNLQANSFSKVQEIVSRSIKIYPYKRTD